MRLFCCKTCLLQHMICYISYVWLVQNKLPAIQDLFWPPSIILLVCRQSGGIKRIYIEDKIYNTRRCTVCLTYLEACSTQCLRRSCGNPKRRGQPSWQRHNRGGFLCIPLPSSTASKPSWVNGMVSAGLPIFENQVCTWTIVLGKSQCWIPTLTFRTDCCILVFVALQECKGQHHLLRASRLCDIRDLHQKHQVGPPPLHSPPN